MYQSTVYSFCFKVGLSLTLNKVSSFQIFNICTSTWYHQLFGIQENRTISINFIKVRTITDY